MFARIDALKPHALLLTVPVTLLWSSHFGVAVGTIVVTLHACGVLFLGAWWTRRDLDRGLSPRLGLCRDRFAVDRELLDLAAPLLGLQVIVLTLVLLFLAPAVGLYALAVLAAGMWNASLRPARRFVMVETIVPVALLVGPAMLLRVPAWEGNPDAATSPGTHAVAWLAGALMLWTVLATMTRDRQADVAAGIVTTVSKRSHESAVALLAIWSLAIPLLTGIGVAAGWWGPAPVVLAAWTSTAVVALFCLRWDSWGAGVAIAGAGLVAMTAAAGAHA